MSFPDTKYVDAFDFARSYFTQIANAAASLDGGQLSQAADIMTRVYSEGGNSLFLWQWWFGSNSQPPCLRSL